MSLLDRVTENTTHDLTCFLPFLVEGGQAGWVQRSLAAELGDFVDDSGRPVFQHGDDRIALAPQLDGFERRSQAMAGVVRELITRGRVPSLAAELYPVAPSFGAAPWFQLERAAMPAFGTRAYGVHMHGYLRRDDGLHMWIARRSRGKTTYPGKLDNLVAGGQPMGLSPRENLTKECAEEADIPADLAQQAHPVGAVTYKFDSPQGLRNDTLFLYDLELPDDFVPRNTDGEVESFELWPIEDVVLRVAETRDFKFNCNLTLIDFFIRHGVLDPEHPEYLALVTGLRS